MLYCLSSTWLLILNDLSVADQASVSSFLAQEFLFSQYAIVKGVSPLDLLVASLPLPQMFVHGCE